MLKSIRIIYTPVYDHYNGIIVMKTGEGNGNPLQYSCLENLMDGEAW